MTPGVASAPATVPVGAIEFGRDAPVRVIAGPCSVESFEQFRAAAVAVQAAGASLLRGGAFKPRTSPYAFQGLGRTGLEIMRAVADELGMGVVTEAMSAEDVLAVAELADVIQIGARNMDNRALLAASGQTGKPVLLKRGLTATVDELLASADLILETGNERVLLCERGTRTFEPSTRNSLDLGAIAEIRARSELPVVVDPSHATGRRDLVTPVSLAAIAAGADALLVEVHPDPDNALSDGAQSLPADDFAAFMDRLRTMASACGRRMEP